jgi:hypothetical protein
MEQTVYLVCAVAGCSIFAIQTILQIFGVFHDAGGIDQIAHEPGDLGHGDAFLGILSFKALTAFVGIFGLTGLAMLQTDASFVVRLVVSIVAGNAGMFFVAFLMRGLSKLQASGTLDIRNALGKTASVYLRIPARSTGEGKVTIEVQGRSLTLNAVTDGAEIPTGHRVTVLEVVGDDTLKVAPV